MTSLRWHDNWAEIASLCVGSDYEEYVSIAKGRYFMTVVKDNDLFKTMLKEINITLTPKEYINNLPTVYIFFPMTCLHAGLQNGFFDFANCLEISSHLRQFLPVHLKSKIKSIAVDEKIAIPIDMPLSDDFKVVLMGCAWGLFDYKRLNKYIQLKQHETTVVIKSAENGHIYVGPPNTKTMYEPI
mgnify:CR=1 FL=1